MTATLTETLKADKNQYLFAALQVMAGSLLIALSAQAAIPLPFTPIRITLQTLAVMLVGGMLGKTKGALAVLVYLGEISFGLPFLSGALSDPLALAGPKGGYLIGMVVQAALVGWYYEKPAMRHFLRAFSFNAFSGVIVLALGALRLSQFVEWHAVLYMGVLPFIVGDIIKSSIVTKLMCRRQRVRL